MASSFAPASISVSSSMFSPDVLMPQGQDPFLLAQPQLRQAQIYVTVGAQFPTALQELANQSRLAGTYSEYQVLFDILSQIYQPFCQHCASFKSVVVQGTQTIAQDIVHYGQSASKICGDLKQILYLWNTAQLSDTDAQAALDTQIQPLLNATQEFASNTTAISQKITDFLQQLTQEQQQFQPAIRQGHQTIEQKVPQWSPARTRLLESLDLAATILPQLLSSLKTSSPILEKLEGVWSAIASDLTNLVQVINQDVQQVPLIISDEGLEEAITAWAKVVQLASDCIQTPMDFNSSVNTITQNLFVPLRPDVTRPIPAHW